MTPKFKAKLKTAINKMRRQWPAIINCKKKAKVGPELYRCEGCKMLIYSGKRSIEYIQLHHPEAIVGVIEIDHVEPVMPLDGRNLTWDEFVGRVFCGEDNLMALCKSGCHQLKSSFEATERARLRKLK